MIGKDIITMSQREIRKLHIIEKAIRKEIKQKEAADILNLSDRHVRRLIKRVRKEGAEGITHRTRGKQSNRAIPKKIKDRVLRYCRGKYREFNPTFASEKLFEMDQIKVSRETIRGWFISEGIPYEKRKARPHRQWRERKHYFGQMQQIDGSKHAWFDDRGPECVLMGYIDDATGNVFARFYSYEGTIPALDSFERYIKKYGIPISAYMDCHAAYQTNRKATVEEELANETPKTQFGRALEELGVRLIPAGSPQAKGRVERLFRTFQDRLIKEMRLRGISTIEDANRFLEYYLPIYNKRFSVEAAQEKDLHRPIPEGLDIRTILCIKTQRRLRNDFTVAHNKKLYQVQDRIRAKKVMVEERLDGKMYITYKGKKLKYKEIERRSKRKKPKVIDDGPFTLWLPPMNHPWKGPSYQRMVASSRLEEHKERRAKFDKFSRFDPLGGQGKLPQSTEGIQQ
jgi:transposase